MIDRYEIRLTGSGGQGLVTAGIILAESAIIDGNDAVQTQSYGAEARGGSSKAEVIVSMNSIAYPKVYIPNIFLAMTSVSYKKYGCDVKADTISVIDSYFIEELMDVPGKSYLLPITDTAIEVAGKEIVANIVAVGVMAALVDPITENGVIEAVKKRIPKGTEAMNLKALHAGIEMGLKVRQHCHTGSSQCQINWEQL